MDLSQLISDLNVLFPHWEIIAAATVGIVHAVSSKYPRMQNLNKQIVGWGAGMALLMLDHYFPGMIQVPLIAGFGLMLATTGTIGVTFKVADKISTKT